MDKDKLMQKLQAMQSEISNMMDMCSGMESEEEDYSEDMGSGEGENDAPMAESPARDIDMLASAFTRKGK